LILLAVIISAPLIVLGSLHILASSIDVSARVISIRVVGSEEDTLLVEADVVLNSSAPVDVGLEEATADLLVNGSVIGQARLAKPITLPSGRGAEALVEARIWGLESLGALVSSAVSGRPSLLEVRARGKASALFLPIWFEKTLVLDIPIPEVEFGDEAQLLNVSLSPSLPHANITLSFKNPMDTAFELERLALSLERDERALASISLLNGPYEFGPRGRNELLLNITFHDDAIADVVAELMAEGHVVGEATGEAIVRIAGAQLLLPSLEFPLDVGFPVNISVSPLDIRVEASDVMAELRARISIGPISGPVWMYSCSSIIYLPSVRAVLGSLNLSRPSPIFLGEESILDIVLRPGEEEVEFVARELMAGAPLELQVLNTTADISVLGSDPFEVEIRRPVTSSIQVDISYNMSLCVLDLWPMEPGNVFDVMAQLNITLSSPISSQIFVRNATFELYNTTGYYLGNGFLKNPMVLPSANGDFSFTMNSTFCLHERAVGWVVQELLDEGSLELVLKSVEASVGVGIFSINVSLPDIGYVYEPGEVGFDVEDVRLVEFDVENNIVVFDIDISIFNPFSFTVNLSRGPSGEPSLFFEFWCQECDVFLGYGRYEGEAMLLPKTRTCITARVDLTPEGALHVISKHYRLWPPPPRIRMKAAVREGVAFIRIYELLVRVRFERENIQVDEPVSPMASGASVYACLEEIGHLHEGSPGLWAPEPFYGSLGLLRQPLHEPPGLLEGASLNQDRAYLLELIWPYIWRA